MIFTCSAVIPLLMAALTLALVKFATARLGNLWFEKSGHAKKKKITKLA